MFLNYIPKCLEHQLFLYYRYLCCCSNSCDPLSNTVGRIPFAFLEDIHKRFVQTYGRAIISAPAYAMNDEFSRVLSQQMDYYSTDPNADRLNRLKGEMTQASCVLFFVESF